jgi:serine/threonine protein kinase
MKCPNCQTENSAESRFCSNCAAPLKETRGEPAVGKTIKVPTFEISRGNLFAGRYEIIEELGAGGMGKVFKAYDQKVKEVIALKLIRPEIGVQEKHIERFRNELKFTRKLTHKNICRMYDLGEEDYIHYITMEYVSGENLKRFVRRAGPLTSGKAISIAKQVCEGLAEAHLQGAIHRDLKPQNIIIDEDGNAKIMDFGIARFVQMDRVTGSGVMIGTPEYMSPEQVDLVEVDKRSDIYSLGIVLYEMVTGKVPFEGETALSIAMKHKTEKPKNARELNAQVSPGMAAIISKCMQKDKAMRYQSAEELLGDLKREEQGLSTAERVVPKKEPAPTREITIKVRPKKILVPAIAVAVVAIAVLAVLKFLPKKEQAVAEVQTAESQIVPEAETGAKDSGEPKRPEKKPLTKSTPQVIESKKTKTDSSQTPKQIQPPKPDQEKPKVEAQPVTPLADTDEAMKSVELALTRMSAAKGRADGEGIDTKALFYRLAAAKDHEAQKLASQRKADEARCLYMIAERLYIISLERKTDEDNLKSLKRYMKGLRKDAEDARDSQNEKLLKSAGDLEKQGEAFEATKDLENAAKAFSEAAFIYERIRWSLQSAKRK